MTNDKQTLEIAELNEENSLLRVRAKKLEKVRENLSGIVKDIDS